MKNLFATALSRLTFAYVSVLTVVCLLFSGYIYNIASNEIDRTSRRQVIGFQGLMGRMLVDPEATEQFRMNEATEARSRLKARLFLANVAVIGAGTLLSYGFAKKTLRPIEDNLKAQERFTSDASHELRTPLAVMRSEIEVALRDSKLSSQEARELLESNLEEVNKLHSMTESLLALARNKEVGEIKLVDVSKLIKELVKKYESASKDAGVQLKLKTSTAKVATNAVAISQSVGILIDNAVRYAGKGSAVVISTKKIDGQVLISVSDDGIGMDEHMLDKVFDRFTRADQSRTHQGKTTGHGLGLSIAKQLVEAAGGKISATSTIGKGSEFRIELPN